MKDIAVVLKHLLEVVLAVKPTNCKFAQDSVRFLGHEVCSGKRSPSVGVRYDGSSGGIWARRGGTLSGSLSKGAYPIFTQRNRRRSPSDVKEKANQVFPTPATKTQVSSFLGMTGYYSRYINDYALIAVPLTNVLKGKVNKK